MRTQDLDHGASELAVPARSASSPVGRRLLLEGTAPAVLVAGMPAAGGQVTQQSGQSLSKLAAMHIEMVPRVSQSARPVPPI